jgi:hypothetical protein
MNSNNLTYAAVGEELNNIKIVKYQQKNNQKMLLLLLQNYDPRVRPRAANFTHGW